MAYGEKPRTSFDGVLINLDRHDHVDHSNATVLRISLMPRSITSLDDLRKARTEFETAIRELVAGFEKATKCPVMSINPEGRIEVKL
jgi:hypothetical protein